MILIQTLAFISIASGTYSFYVFLNNSVTESKKKQRIKALLSGERHDLDQEYSIKHIARKYYEKITHIFINKYLSDRYKSSVTNDLYLAGKRSNNALQEFYIKSFAMATICAALPLILGLDPLMSPVAGVLAFMLPKLELDSIKKKRQKEMQKEEMQRRLEIKEKNKKDREGNKI